MNKYTVIYGRYFRVGIHTNSVTCYSHIEGETVDDAVEKSNINWNDIWFIFDGPEYLAKILKLQGFDGDFAERFVNHASGSKM